jgi:hypothetical protein
MSGGIGVSVVTLRLPDDVCEGLKWLAASRGISLDRLMEDLGTAALAAHDAEARFRAMAAGAGRERALGVLDRLDDVDRGRCEVGPPPRL